MKKLFSILMIAFLAISMVGCGSTSSSSNTSEEESGDNLIAGKIYSINTPQSEDAFDFEFVKFYDDNTFLGVESKNGHRDSDDNVVYDYEKYYGTYSVDGSALELKMSSDTYAVYTGLSVPPARSNCTVLPVK